MTWSRIAGCIAFLVWGTALADDGEAVRLRDGAELSVERHPAAGRDLILYLPTGLGRAEGESRLTAALARQGMTVWRPDFFEARFLPPLESSLGEIGDDDLTAVLRAAQATGKRVYLMGAARGGLLALRMVAAAARAKLPAPAGLILLHPNAYAGAPAPGAEAQFHPAVAQTHVPVFVLQPERSPWRWRLASLAAELRRGGAPVYTQFLPDVRDRFYFRPDATDAEDKAAATLPAHVARATAMLARERAAAPRTATAAPARVRDGTARRGLQPYKGDATPPSLALVDLAGKRHALGDYRGQAVLVNFWASWCPPCVHEMPSMQRLAAKLAGRPFTILAVNMGEDERTIRAFLEKVKVDFPVLLDRDGAALKRWKVFVFPTSFLIGPDGAIRYALFGEFAWDDAEAVKVIEGMLPGRP